MDLRSQRGSSLVIAFISMVVVSAIAVAVIRYSAMELSAAAAGRRHAQRVACTDACSGLVMSRYHALSGGPGSIGAPPFTVDPQTGLTARSGDMDVTQVQIKQVQRLPPTSFGTTALGDLTNTIRAPPSSPYRVLCTCADADGRAIEAEFGVSLGI